MKTPEFVEKYKGAFPDVHGRTKWKTWDDLAKDMAKDLEIHATSQIEDLTKEVERLKKLIVPETGRQFEINRLKSENDRYREALERIHNPIKWMQDDAKNSSHQLNGVMAIQLSKDAEYLKSIAYSALHPLVKEGE